jgi:hypothetical protein
MKLYADDIDNNGKIDPVLFYYSKDENGDRKLYPSINLEKLAANIPVIKKKFSTNKDFAKATPDEIFTDSKNLQILKCNETRSCWLENKGNGKFEMHALPMEAQFAPVNAIVCADVDGDGIKDILLAGNEYQNDVTAGRYDASYGYFLKGMGNKNFKAISPSASGFFIDGDVKDMKLITNSKREKLILIAVNNDSLRVFKCR